MRKKIAIFGAGNVGASLAQLIVLNELADVALVDVALGLAEAKALDLSQAKPIYRSDVKVIGGVEPSLIKGADLVVITAGAVRKPGMSRDELLETNAKIVAQCARATKKYAKNSILIVVTNPLDAMTWLAYKISGFEKNRVMGMAGVLDSARFCYFLSEELGASVKDLNAMVLGGHGDDMVPLLSTASLKGQRISKLIPKEKLDKIIERTRRAGAEIVEKMKTSAFYSPSASIFEMIRAIFNDEKRLLACSAILSGEYGLKDIAFGVPCVLGKKGVEKIVEFELSKKEKQELNKSARRVKNLIEKLSSFKL